ncbi:hypothetical protein Aperf_G00000081522 [Anoplocephala perfoliata]
MTSSAAKKLMYRRFQHFRNISSTGLPSNSMDDKGTPIADIDDAIDVRTNNRLAKFISVWSALNDGVIAPDDLCNHLLHVYHTVIFEVQRYWILCLLQLCAKYNQNFAEALRKQEQTLLDIEKSGSANLQMKLSQILKLLNICPSQSMKFSSTDVNESWLPDKYVNGEMTEMFYYDLQKASVALSTHEFRKRIRNLRDANAKGCVDKNELEACLKKLEKQEDVWNFVLEHYDPKLPIREDGLFLPRQTNYDKLCRIKAQKSKLGEPCKYAKDTLMQIKKATESTTKVKDEKEINQQCTSPVDVDSSDGGSQANKGHENTKTTAHPQGEKQTMQGQGASTHTPYPQAKSEVDKRSECSTNLNNAQDGNNTVPTRETLNNTGSPRHLDKGRQECASSTNPSYSQGENKDSLTNRISVRPNCNARDENELKQTRGNPTSTDCYQAKSEVDKRSECSTNLNNAQDGNNTVPTRETLNNTDSPRGYPQSVRDVYYSSTNRAPLENEIRQMNIFSSIPSSVHDLDKGRQECASSTNPSYSQGENKDSLTNRISVRPNCNARDENELKQTRGNPTSTDCYQGGSQANKGHENPKTTAYPQGEKQTMQGQGASTHTPYPQAKSEVDKRSECSTNLNNAQDGNNTVPTRETLNNTGSPRHLDKGRQECASSTNPSYSQGENKDSLTNRISVRPNCNARDENELKQTRGNPTSTDCYQGGSQANKGHENPKTTAYPQGEKQTMQGQGASTHTPYPQAKSEVDKRSECSTNLNNAQDGNNTVPTRETLNNTGSPRGGNKTDVVHRFQINALALRILTFPPNGFTFAILATKGCRHGQLFNFIDEGVK